MAARGNQAGLPDPSGYRVPLRRLSTKRFKTLEARRQDAARRRARRAVNKTGQRLGIDWDTVKEARSTGIPWSAIADIMAKQADLARRYDDGEDLHGEGKAFWDARDPDLPDDLYYYHGIFR